MEPGWTEDVRKRCTVYGFSLLGSYGGGGHLPRTPVAWLPGGAMADLHTSSTRTGGLGGGEKALGVWAEACNPLIQQSMLGNAFA